MFSSYYYLSYHIYIYIIAIWFKLASVLVIPSCLAVDPGNHGHRKTLIASDEVGRQVSPCDNLSSSLNTLKQFFKIGKHTKYNFLIEDIVPKTQEPRDGGIFTSSFTLLAEGISLYF